MAANCTGTATFTNQNNQVEHDNFILNNGDKGAFLIQTDAGHTQSSVAVAEGLATCSDLGVKHTYSFEGTGLVLGTGQVAYAGRLVLNGMGSITGTATASLNGTMTSSATVTGSYTINSNCTGTMSITPKGLPTINLNVVVVNADKELLFVETDANTIVGGTLQM